MVSPEPSAARSRSRPEIVSRAAPDAWASVPKNPETGWPSTHRRPPARHLSHGHAVPTEAEVVAVLHRVDA